MANYLDKTGLQKLINLIKSWAQPLLVSGTNIKTINNESILGSGNISITTSEGSEPYTLPTASDSVLGGVKVGTGLQIDGSGILSTKEISIASTSENGLMSSTDKQKLDELEPIKDTEIDTIFNQIISEN